MKLLFAGSILLFVTNSFAAVEDFQTIINDNQAAQRELANAVVDATIDNSQLKNSVFFRSHEETSEPLEEVSVTLVHD